MRDHFLTLVHALRGPTKKLPPSISLEHRRSKGCPYYWQCYEPMQSYHKHYELLVSNKTNLQGVVVDFVLVECLLEIDEFRT